MPKIDSVNRTQKHHFVSVTYKDSPEEELYDGLNGAAALQAYLYALHIGMERPIFELVWSISNLPEDPDEETTITTSTTVPATD